MMMIVMIVMIMNMKMRSEGQDSEMMIIAVEMIVDESEGGGFVCVEHP